MAEAVAALYAVETALEGAAVGAYVASRPTVPLHVKFKKLQSLRHSSGDGAWQPTTGHTLNVIKGKAYIYGGDVLDGKPSSGVKAVTLPSSVDSEEVDFQIVKPEVAQSRPLQAYSDKATSSLTGADDSTAEADNEMPEVRAEHSSAIIGQNIFVLGGRPARHISSHELSQQSAAEAPFPLTTLYCFSTQNSTWLTIRANPAACKAGLPPPRTRASCSSSSHPSPGSGIDVTITAHGTIFIHGGYDANGGMLRDAWAFDINSRAWSRLPDIPDPSAQEVAGEGRIIYHNGSICRVGDGFGKVMYLDIDIPQGPVVTSTSGPHESEVALKPASNEWQVITFGTSSDEKPLAQSESLPVPRKGAGFLPVTTGTGRFYNLYFMGQDGPGSVLNDIWTLQVRSESNSGAAIKDKIRKAVGKGTGENQWALCEVVQSTKEDGPLELPKGMTDFAADTWKDLGGGHVLIWGGKAADGSLENGGWIMSVE